MIQKNVLKDAWRDVDFSEFWNDQLERPEKDTCGIEPVVCCNIPNLDTDKRMIVNGFGDTGKLVIPDNAQLQKPIQIQSVVKSDRKALVEVNSVIEAGGFNGSPAAWIKSHNGVSGTTDYIIEQYDMLERKLHPEW